MMVIPIFNPKGHVVRIGFGEKPKQLAQILGGIGFHRIPFFSWKRDRRKYQLINPQKEVLMTFDYFPTVSQRENDVWNEEFNICFQLVSEGILEMFLDKEKILEKALGVLHSLSERYNPVMLNRNGLGKNPYHLIENFDPDYLKEILNPRTIEFANSLRPHIQSLEDVYI